VIFNNTIKIHTPDRNKGEIGTKIKDVGIK
jgi:hypothetical protein